MAGNIAGDVDFLAELQGLLKIDARVIVIAFEKIGVAYIVQAKSLVVLIAQSSVGFAELP